MLDLSNGANWLKTYDQSFTATPVASKPGKYNPIPGFIVPTLIDKQIVAVSIKVVSPKPTWRFGGEVFPIITVTGSDLTELKRNKNYPILLGTPLEVFVSTGTSSYRLGVSLAKWLTNARVEVWVNQQATAPEPTLEYIGGLLLETNADIQIIENELQQIETKIDNL